MKYIEVIFTVELSELRTVEIIAKVIILCVL